MYVNKKALCEHNLCSKGARETAYVCICTATEKRTFIIVFTVYHDKKISALYICKTSRIANLTSTKKKNEAIYVQNCLVANKMGVFGMANTVYKILNNCVYR